MIRFVFSYWPEFWRRNQQVGPQGCEAEYSVNKHQIFEESSSVGDPGAHLPRSKESEDHKPGHLPSLGKGMNWMRERGREKKVQEAKVSVFLHLLSFHFTANRGRVESFPIIVSVLNVDTVQAADSATSYRRTLFYLTNIARHFVSACLSCKPWQQCDLLWNSGRKRQHGIGHNKYWPYERNWNPSTTPLDIWELDFPHLCRSALGNTPLHLSLKIRKSKAITTIYGLL